MKVRVGARSDIGRARERNEDAYLLKEPLFAVADGMGGHRGGDVASSLALEILEAGDTAEAAPESTEGEGPASRPLVATISRANHALLERAESDRELRGMGTTLTAVVTDDARAFVAHIGDSRAYLLRDRILQQLTEDHTLVQRMVREGRITPAEAGTHPQRSVLTRALGVEEDVSVDELTLDVHSGDRLLLCTDGLTTMVDRERIQEILEQEKEPQAACDKLIDAANRAGGDDNVTVVVLDFIDGAAEGGDGETVVRDRPEKGPPPRPAPEQAREEDADAKRSGPRRQVRWWRVAMWVAVIIAVLAAVLVGARLYIDRQWYVGDAGGRVAIYNGIPTDILGFDLSNLRQTTELSTAEAERLQPWRSLSDGITAGSFEEAQALVEQIRRDLQSLPAGRSP